MSERPVRVLIADDQTLFRVGLARLLDADSRIEVVAEAADGLEAVEQCERLSPDVVLMDLKMPGMDGIEATRCIKALGKGTKVMVLTTFNSDSEVLSALRAGATGYLLKDAQAEALICSVIAVSMGEQVLSGPVATSMASGRGAAAANGARSSDAHDHLTERELEILRLIAGGVSNKQIARQLVISDKTVRNHLSNIYGKLNIGDRSQAVLYAMRKGMVEV
jgi:DNA-binding NarL/FixJ family response regulator